MAQGRLGAEHLAAADGLAEADGRACAWSTADVVEVVCRAAEVAGRGSSGAGLVGCADCGAAGPAAHKGGEHQRRCRHRRPGRLRHRGAGAREVRGGMAPGRCKARVDDPLPRRLAGALPQRRRRERDAHLPLAVFGALAACTTGCRSSVSARLPHHGLPRRRGLGRPLRRADPCATGTAAASGPAAAARWRGPAGRRGELRGDHVAARGCSAPQRTPRAAAGALRTRRRAGGEGPVPAVGLCGAVMTRASWPQAAVTRGGRETH
mmetsp:Transcript_12844/g.37002  ORF Transcript_12844/g.37002 Transcript_12844/m.37002 type:complete len:265 (-) Transcript_12844:111-905(-)